MKCLTSDLVGDSLDWQVYKLEFPDCTVEHFHRMRYQFLYSTVWSCGGPILEREKITITYFKSSCIDAEPFCVASISTDYTDDKSIWMSGPSALVAAMRCFVANRCGSEVEYENGYLALPEWRT
jgi:hypothetical protein